VVNIFCLGDDLHLLRFLRGAARETPAHLLLFFLPPCLSHTPPKDLFYAPRSRRVLLSVSLRARHLQIYLVRSIDQAFVAREPLLRVSTAQKHLA